jgi:hypothetical protein
MRAGWVSAGWQPAAVLSYGSEEGRLHEVVSSSFGSFPLAFDSFAEPRGNV